jgi:RNA polymerase sigma-70 factor (ECF subfamily)
MLHDRHAAEDAVQEAAIKAWRHLDRLSPAAAPPAWFLTIVANQCRDVRRGRWWRMVPLDALPERTAPDPSERLIHELELHRAMARLTPEQRGLLLLHYQLDMPVQEMATVLSLRPGTVKSRLHRALRRLQAKCSPAK